MPFFPTEKFEIETELKLDDAAHRLQNATTTDRARLFSKWGEVLFQGQISLLGCPVASSFLLIRVKAGNYPSLSFRRNPESSNFISL